MGWAEPALQSQNGCWTGAFLHLLRLALLGIVIYLALALPLAPLLQRTTVLGEMPYGELRAIGTGLGSYLIAFLWLLPPRPDRRAALRRLYVSAGLMLVAWAAIVPGIFVAAASFGLAAPVIGFMAGVAVIMLFDVAVPVSDADRKSWFRVHVGGAVLASLLFVLAYVQLFNLPRWALAADVLPLLGLVLGLPHAVLATWLLARRQALPPPDLQGRQTLVLLLAVLVLFVVWRLAGTAGWPPSTASE